MSTSTALLFKVPLLLGAGYATHVGLVSPTPTPSKAEEQQFGDAEPRLSRAMLTRTKYLVMPVNWTAYLGEIAVILALLLPEQPLSKAVLRYLPAHGALRLSGSFLVGTVFTIAGGLLRALCYRQLGKNFTYELTLRKDHTLETGGPYAYVRHPSYTAVLAISLGTGLVQMGPGSWWVECCGLWSTSMGRLFGLWWTFTRFWVCGAVLYRTGKEDEVMRKTFGEQWDEWARRTPYKIFPGIW